MNDENIQDIDLENNDVTETVDTTTVDETELATQELEDLRAFKADIEKKNAIARRLAKKAPTNTNKPNLIDEDLAKDIAEFKFDRKVSRFADENGISRLQAERLFNLKPNATADDLKDEFIKAGLEAVSKQNRVVANTPRGRNSVSSTPAKTLSEMTQTEKEAWYQSR